MSLESRSVGVLALTGAQALVLFLGWITHPIIGRVLGRESYGVYGLILAIQSIISIILTLGIPTAVSRYVAQNPGRAHSLLKQGLRWQLALALLIASLTTLAAPFAAHALQDPTLTNLIRFSGLVILLQSLYPIFAQFFAGLHRFNKQALLTIIYAIAKLAGALTLMYFFGVLGAFAGFAVGGAVAAAIGWLWSRSLKTSGKQESASPTITTKSLLSFAGTYVLILAGLQLLISLDLFMMKAFVPDNAAIGDYNAAVTLSRIPYLLLQGLGFVLLPSVAALTRPGASHDNSVAFIRRTLRYLIAIIVPGVAIAAVTSHELIHLFFSRDFLAAAPAFTILIIGLGSLSFYLLLANIASGAGRAKTVLGITMLLIALSAALGTLLIPRFGSLGAAWQTTITGLTGLIILAAYTFHTFRIPVPWLSAINITLAGAAAASISLIWPPGLYTLPVFYLAAGLVYLGALTLLREITPADRRLIANLHPRLKWLAPS